MSICLSVRYTHTHTHTHTHTQHATGEMGLTPDSSIECPEQTWAWTTMGRQGGAKPRGKWKRGFIVAQNPPHRRSPWRLVGRFGCTRRPMRGPLWGVRVRASTRARRCRWLGEGLGLLCPPTSPSRCVWLCKALTSLHQGRISGEVASPSRLLTAS